MMKRSFFALLALMIVVSTVSGCNTFKGAGKDIERGGEAIQDAAE